MPVSLRFSEGQVRKLETETTPKSNQAKIHVCPVENKTGVHLLMGDENKHQKSKWRVKLGLERTL